MAIATALLSGFMYSACAGSPPADRAATLASPSRVGATPGQTTPSPSAASTDSPEATAPTTNKPIDEGCNLDGGIPRGTFDDVAGWIAYRCGSTIVAVDPANPQATASLGSIKGCPTGPHYQHHCQWADPIGWSRDGRSLLLMVVFLRGLGSDLWVMNEDGSVKRVTTHEDAAWGSFSPDGSRIAYGCCGSEPGPFVIDADGGTPRSLGHPCGMCGEPLGEVAAWGPRGLRIAWLDFEEDSEMYGHHAYVLSYADPDGAGVRTEVAPVPGGANLVWSPDGSRLAFWDGDDAAFWYHNSRRSGEPGQIFVIHADGSHLRQLTHRGDNRWPAWSPDGSRLAFVHNHRLFTMAIDGTDMRPVWGSRPDGAIAWNWTS